jgi:hypothetical protein
LFLFFLTADEGRTLNSPEFEMEEGVPNSSGKTCSGVGVAELTLKKGCWSLLTNPDVDCGLFFPRSSLAPSCG